MCMQWLLQKIQACLPNIECTTYTGDSRSDHPGNALDCFSKKGRPCPATGEAQTDLDELAAWGIENAVPLKVRSQTYYNVCAGVELSNFVRCR